MPRLMYGFLFNVGIKELVDPLLEEDSEIMETLNELYSEEDIVFGVLHSSDSDDYYCYAAMEITNDIYKDAEDNFFSMDLDQIKSNDKTMFKFIDKHNELNEVAYCDSPRIFFIE
jgi:hypothetical protein